MREVSNFFDQDTRDTNKKINLFQTSVSIPTGWTFKTSICECDIVWWTFHCEDYKFTKLKRMWCGRNYYHLTYGPRYKHTPQTFLIHFFFSINTLAVSGRIRLADSDGIGWSIIRCEGVEAVTLIALLLGLAWLFGNSSTY